MSAPTSAAALLANFCAEAGTRLDGDAAAFVRRIEDELTERRVRVAVVGSISSGKSTLVNAFIGRRAAPTDARECTRIITCYRYAEQTRTLVHLRSGQVVDVSASTDGGPPVELPAPADEVDFIEVGLPSDPLWHVTLFDTPGISSTDPSASTRTEDLFSAGRTRMPRPDAIAFVMTQRVRADEAQLLQLVAGATSGASASVHTVGVLTKADLLDSGGDGAWQAATDLASRIAHDHREMLSAVVPVRGLLAETGNCRLLTNDEAAALTSLATEWDTETREVCLLHEPGFLRSESRVGAADRKTLVAVLGLTGIRELLPQVDAGVVGAAQLNAVCRRMSGLEQLRAAVDRQFRERADALKASRALAELNSGVYGPLGAHASTATRTWMRDELESIILHPHLHRVRELELLHQVIAGRIELPDLLRDDVEALVDYNGNPPNPLGLDAWKQFELDARSAGQRSAVQTMARSYALATRRRTQEV